MTTKTPCPVYPGQGVLFLYETGRAGPMQPPLGGHFLTKAVFGLLKMPLDPVTGFGEALLHQRRFFRIKAERRR